jgi:hypothetical protein
MRPSRRSLIAALVIVGLVAAVPASAYASRYLSRAKASKVAKRHARQFVTGTPSMVKARCWPTGRRHTQYNLQFLWTKWDCGWSVRSTHTDGRVADCHGKIRVTGKRHGSRHRVVRAGRCVQVRGPTPPPGLGARQKQLRAAAINYGIGYANQLINTNFGSSGLYYYGQINTPECQFVNLTLVNCPMYVWFESWNTDANFYTHVSRLIYQVWTHAEDLGTSVGFRAWTEPQGVFVFDVNTAYYVLCSNDWFIGPPACPANRFPVAYPPQGPPYPNPT